jgi:hypothetical protein
MNFFPLLRSQTGQNRCAGKRQSKTAGKIRTGKDCQDPVDQLGTCLQKQEKVYAIGCVISKQLCSADTTCCSEALRRYQATPGLIYPSIL